MPAHSIIPAKAGLVSYADEAYIDNRAVDDHVFEVNENAVLRTAGGHAEVLLGPCAAMWIDGNSSFRMISIAVSDIRIEVLTGSVIVAVGEPVKETKVTLLLKTSVASLNPKGAYRFDAEPPRVKVLAGRSTLQWANHSISVTAGRWLPLQGPAHVRKFDKRNPDPLDNWSNDWAALWARLSDLQTGSVQDSSQPVTQAELDAIKTTVRSKLPPSHNDVPVSLPRMPNSRVRGFRYGLGQRTSADSAPKGP